MLCIAVLVIGANKAYATSRMADAEVRLQGLAPCFGISIREEQDRGVPILKAMDVTDVLQKKSIWGFFIPKKNDHLKMPASYCAPYGQIPPGGIGDAAPALENGRMYDIYLNGRTADPGDSTMGYQARFCLFERPDGGLRLVQFAPGSPGWRQGSCSLSAQ
jgi:hypothetical protein